MIASDLLVCHGFSLLIWQIIGIALIVFLIYIFYRILKRFDILVVIPFIIFALFLNQT